MLADDVGGIPGHVHDLRFGAQGPHPLGELTAVHDRHHDVGEQEVDGALVLFANRQRLVGRGRLQHDIVLEPQDSAGERPNFPVIVHQ